MARIKEPYVHIQERVRETPTLLNIDGSTNIGGVVVSPKGKRYQYIEGPKDFLEKLVGAEELPRDSHVSLINAYYCSYFAGLVVARALNTNATGGLMIYLDGKSNDPKEVKLINGSILNKKVTHNFNGLDKIGWAFLLHGILFYCLDDETKLDSEVLYLYPGLASVTKVNCKQLISEGKNDSSYALRRIKDSINSLEGVCAEFDDVSFEIDEVAPSDESSYELVDSQVEAIKSSRGTNGKLGKYKYVSSIDETAKDYFAYRFGTRMSATRIDDLPKNEDGEVTTYGSFLDPTLVTYDSNNNPTLKSVIETINSNATYRSKEKKDSILYVPRKEYVDEMREELNDESQETPVFDPKKYLLYKIIDKDEKGLYRCIDEDLLSSDEKPGDSNAKFINSTSDSKDSDGNKFEETTNSQDGPIYYLKSYIPVYTYGHTENKSVIAVNLNDPNEWRTLPSNYQASCYVVIDNNGYGKIPEPGEEIVTISHTSEEMASLNVDYLLIACTETLGPVGSDHPYKVSIKKINSTDHPNEIFRLSINEVGKKPLNYTVSLNPGATYDGVNCFIENYNPQLKDYQFILNVSDTFGLHNEYKNLPDNLNAGFGNSGFDKKDSIDPSYFSTAIYKLGEQEEFQIEYLSDFGYTDTNYLKDYIYVGKEHWWFTPVSIPFSYTNAAVMENFGNGIASNNNTIIIGPFDKNSTFLGFPAKIAPTSKYYERVFANKANGAEYAPLFEETNGVLTYVNPSAMIDATGRVALLNASSGPINFLVYNQRNNQYYFNDNRCHTTDNNVMSEEMNRRMINRINKDVKVLMNRMKGRVNSNTTRQLVQDLIDLYMSQNIYTQQYKPVEHQVVCDETNNGDAIIAANQLQVTLRIRLYGSIKFIDVLDDIFPLGVDFEASLS